MKNIYFVQPNYTYGDAAHFPYAAGTLAAYAWSIDAIREKYKLGRIIYLREDIDDAIDSFDSPFLVGFSNYLWNHQYNLTFAKRLKERCPECVIVFGGHDVPPDTTLLIDCPFIDILIHGDGEEPFAGLLSALDGDGDLSSINNLSFRSGDEIVSTPHVTYSRTDYPSPYLAGIFDDIVNTSPYKMLPTFETNRGCPYHCAYCDWGHLESRVIFFPLERVFAELDWFAKHKCDFVLCADSNFGMFRRDDKIIDYLIDCKKRTGYPSKFQVSYAKYSNETVLNMIKKLSDNGMNKGATLSFQSLSPAVLDIIGRKNMDINSFSDLLSLYKKAGISTCSELILGLPGETCASFRDGIEQLLEAGQHSSLIVHNCISLPNSQLGDQELIEKYGILRVRTPLNQQHSVPDHSDITEYNLSVVGTSSMPPEDWILSNIFSVTVQSLHCMGPLRCFALYLFAQKGIGYADFYHALTEWARENPDTVLGRALASLRSILEGLIDGTASVCCVDEKFGDIAWPLEEVTFLRVAYELDAFYAELDEFLRAYGIDDKIFDDLLLLQRSIIALPGKAGFDISLDSDLYTYLGHIENCEPASLDRRATQVSAHTERVFDSWRDYAREVVWYGRRGGQCIFNDCRVNYTTEASEK